MTRRRVRGEPTVDLIAAQRLQQEIIRKQETVVRTRFLRHFHDKGKQPFTPEEVYNIIKDIMKQGMAGNLSWEQIEAAGRKVFQTKEGFPSAEAIRRCREVAALPISDEKPDPDIDTKDKDVKFAELKARMRKELIERHLAAIASSYPNKQIPDNQLTNVIEQIRDRVSFLIPEASEKEVLDIWKTLNSKNS